MKEDRVPDAELDVLACLWNDGESTARGIRDRLGEARPMAHASVVTLLNRLEKKGWIQRRKGTVGKAFLYKASRKPDGIARRLIRDLLHRVFANDGPRLVASVFETAPPTRDEVKELRKLLDELERKQDEEDDDGNSR